MYPITHNVIATYYYLFTYDSQQLPKDMQIHIRDTAFIQVNTVCIQLLYRNTFDSGDKTT